MAGSVNKVILVENLGRGPDQTNILYKHNFLMVTQNDGKTLAFNAGLAFPGCYD